MVKAVVLALALLAPAGPILAAPFCVQTQSVPAQCLYFDATSCARRAAELNGSCSANPAELKITAGFSTYCVVDSTRIPQCLYASFDSCVAEAARKHALCIRAQRPPAPGQAEDPFQLIRP